MCVVLGHLRERATVGVRSEPGIAVVFGLLIGSFLSLVLGPMAGPILVGIPLSLYLGWKGVSAWAGGRPWRRIVVLGYVLGLAATIGVAMRNPAEVATWDSAVTLALIFVIGIGPLGVIPATVLYFLADIYVNGNDSHADPSEDVNPYPHRRKW